MLIQLFKPAVVASHVVVVVAAAAVEVVRERRPDPLLGADLCFGIVHESLHRRCFARAKLTDGIVPVSTQVEQFAVLRHKQ